MEHRRAHPHPLSQAILKALPIIVMLTQAVTCQTTPESKNYSLTLGVGDGVIAVGFFFVLGIIICILGRCSGNPMFMVLAGILLPVIIFLIIYALPTESQRPVKTGPSLPTDGSIIGRGFFFAMIFIFLLIALFLWCASVCLNQQRAIQLSSKNAKLGQQLKKQIQIPTNSQNLKKDRSKYLTAPQIEYRSYAVQGGGYAKDGLGGVQDNTAQPYLYDQAQLTRKAKEENEPLNQPQNQQRDESQQPLIDRQTRQNEYAPQGSQFPPINQNQNQRNQHLLSDKGEVDLRGSKVVAPRKLEPIGSKGRGKRDLDMNIGEEQVNRRDVDMDDDIMNRTIKPENIDPYFESQLNQNY